jgi:hypothetical protein
VRFSLSISTSGWYSLILVLVLSMTAAPTGRAQACTGTGLVSIVPSAPTSATPITVQFLGLHESCSTLTYRIEGNVIMIENVWNCAIGVLTSPRELNVGALPPGTYSVRVYDIPNATLADPPVACGSVTVIAVASRPVPTLSTTLMLVAVSFLAVFGVLMLRRPL